MGLKTAEDMMVSVRQYPHVPDSLKISDAIIILKRSEMDVPDGRRTVPRVLLVFNDELRFVGMVRRRDILRGLEPEFMSGPKEVKGWTSPYLKMQTDANLFELSFDKTAEGMCERGKQLVRSIMIHFPATINHDDHLVKAMRQIVDNDAPVLPVLKDGKVVGVLRSLDVLHEIALVCEIDWKRLDRFKKKKTDGDSNG